MAAGPRGLRARPWRRSLCRAGKVLLGYRSALRKRKPRWAAPHGRPAMRTINAAAMHESGVGPKRRSRNVRSRAAVKGIADIKAPLSFSYTWFEFEVPWSTNDLVPFG